MDDTAVTTVPGATGDGASLAEQTKEVIGYLTSGTLLPEDQAEQLLFRLVRNAVTGCCYAAGRTATPVSTQHLDAFKAVQESAFKIWTP